MFKYAPGMESGLGAALNMMRKHAEPDGDEGTTVTNIFNMEDKESGTNDIAGLMALMQNNKGMDLPGILALCQQKGYGREGGGWGDGMGLLVILLFFLMFNNGGWGNNVNKACAEGLVGADNCLPLSRASHTMRNPPMNVGRNTVIRARCLRMPRMAVK